MIRLMLAAALLTVPEFGTVAEAAAVFRSGTKAIYAGVEAGTIPHIRLGKRTIRIPIRAIVEAAERQAAQSSAPGMRSGGTEIPAPIRTIHHDR